MSPERPELSEIYLNPETENEEQFFRSFFELTPQEEQVFRGQVEKSRGAARIVVHPFFEQYWHNDNKDRDSDLVGEGMMRIANANYEGESDIKPPVIIMEVEEYIHETTNKIFAKKSAVKPKKPIYIVPTFKESSTPKLDGELSSRGNAHKREVNFRVFARRLQALGVKKIILGGMYLFTPTLREIHQYKNEKACVDSAKEYLQKDFEIEISNFSYPANHKNKNEIE